jgi:phenylacetate-CoA ligase
MMVKPWSDRYWSECETWSRDQIEATQTAMLARQLRRVYESSEFYRQRYAAIGWSPEDFSGLESLRALPLTTKSDYVASIAADPPFGTAVAQPPDRLRRVHFSSGTTSEPTPVFWTGRDLNRWADSYARAAYSQGVRNTDRYQCLFNYSWFVGGLGATAGYQRLGCMCIPGGSSDSRRQLDTIVRMGTTVVGGTPSFLLHLAEVADAAGIGLQGSAVRVVMTGGEPGAAIAGIRGRIEQEWGAKAFDGYGSIEFQPIAWECWAQSGGHLVEDFAFAEILDPDTRGPVADGEPGVLVLTHLDKRAVPLVRWWTGDVVARDSRVCECGRTMARLPGGVKGRADDMLVIRGVNLFPSAVEDVVRRTASAGTEFRIVVDDSSKDPATGFLTGIRLEVESDAQIPDLCARLEKQVRQELLVRAVVREVPPGSLPRFTHKARRVVSEG